MTHHPYADLPPEYIFEDEFEKMMAREQCEDEFEMDECKHCRYHNECEFREELLERKAKLDASLEAPDSTGG